MYWMWWLSFLLGMKLPFFGIQAHSLATIPFAFISMILLYAIIKHQYLRIQKNIEEIEKTGRLKRYLSPQVVQTIMSEHDSGQTFNNERREVTIFFSDPRGFTSFSDTVEPEEVMQLLNKYHAEMGNLIFNYNGTLERFAGDGIMVIFGAPISFPDHALRAVRMVLEMQAKVGELKKGWERKDYLLDIGMGFRVDTRRWVV